MASAQITRTEIVEPRTLDAAARDALVSSLYAVHCEIFDGVSRDEFARYVVESTAERTRIQLSYGEGGELAGYLAMHAFRPTLRGEVCTVLRAEAGLRRRYRGSASTAGFALSNLARTHLEYSGPLFYLGCLVHPSSYSIFANNAPTLWPAPGEDVPEDLLDLMMRLGEEFHLEQVDAARPLVRKVGWITRDSDAERRYWRTCPAPGARFYLEQNPGYVDGHGLLTLVPLDPPTVARWAVRVGAARLHKGLRRALGALARGPLARPLGEDDAEALLARVEAQTGLNLDAVRAEGRVGTRYPLSARQALFRRGAQSDALYVVLSGSLFVLDDSDPENEVVIDQLGPDTLAGEQEILTKEPRRATVRAAIDSVLLRLTSEDLGRLFAAEPRLAEALAAYGQSSMDGAPLRYALSRS